VLQNRLSLQMASYTNHGVNTSNDLLRTDSSKWPPPRMVAKTCINRKQLINKENEFITILYYQFHSQHIRCLMLCTTQDDASMPPHSLSPPLTSVDWGISMVYGRTSSVAVMTTSTLKSTSSTPTSVAWSAPMGTTCVVPRTPYSHNGMG
jgi:hypothetical protein